MTHGCHVGHWIQALLEGEVLDAGVRREIADFLTQTATACDEPLSELFRPRPQAYGGILESALASLEEQAHQLERMAQEADRDLTDLMRAVPAERRLKVHRALARFRSPLLVERLVEECRRQVTVDPFEAYELASLARDVALRVPHSVWGAAPAMTALALATAFQGNALRAAGDLRGAQPLLDFALSLFLDQGDLDPLVEAELHHLAALLCRDGRRIAAAEEHLYRAREIYLECGEDEALARLLISQATTECEDGRVEAALRTTEEALRHIDHLSDPRLSLMAEHNLTSYLQHLGRFAEAEARLGANAALYEQFPEAWTQRRRRWLEARIARGLGRVDQAERAFLTLREELLSQGLGYDAALAGLELALVHLQLGRGDKVRRLAEEMVPIFLAQDIGREAMAALLLFAEAAVRDSATTTMVLELIGFLERTPRSVQRRGCGRG
ncbi:MAG TPA: hypothetical protein VF017_08515 [Thermoanaerobaculia bacterium]|nr:hypothetical protein [Thermoanaerobaculia bacterium]